jgi:hypothetical protein
MLSKIHKTLTIRSLKTLLFVNEIFIVSVTFSVYQHKRLSSYLTPLSKALLETLIVTFYGIRKVLCQAQKSPQIRGLVQHFVTRWFSLMWKVLAPVLQVLPCTQSVFATALHIWRRSPQSSTWERAMPSWQRHPLKTELNLQLIVWSFVRSQVLTPVTTKSTIVWVVTPCSLISEECIASFLMVEM